MKVLDPAMSAHLEGEATTLCTCWRLLRRDGMQFGFTDHDRDVLFDSLVFEAASGFRAGEIERALGFGIDNQSVAGALSSGRIAAEDLRADRYDGARIEVWTVNWCDPALRCLDQVFVMGETIEEDGRFRAELEGVTAALNHGSGRRFIRNCDADLGDPRCGANLELPQFSAQATVSAILSPMAILADGLEGFESGWFRGGRLRFLSGANTGLGIEIAEHIAESGRQALHLWKTPAFESGAGDEFSITAGCAKTFSQCKEKFANQLNFRGFPHIPGNDFTFGAAYPDAQMDGGPLIP